MLTPENEKYYGEIKRRSDDFMLDYQEYLQIISEFKSNPILRKIHAQITDYMCEHNKIDGESIPVVESLYVLTLRKMAEIIDLEVNLDDYSIFYKAASKGDDNE